MKKLIYTKESQEEILAFIGSKARKTIDGSLYAIGYGTISPGDRIVKHKDGRIEVFTSEETFNKFYRKVDGKYRIFVEGPAVPRF
jgi:hypothetical protein